MGCAAARMVLGRLASRTPSGQMARNKPQRRVGLVAQRLIAPRGAARALAGGVPAPDDGELSFRHGPAGPGWVGGS